MLVCFSRIARADIVLTTYDIVRKEAGLSDEERKNKALYEMPATDGNVSKGYSDFPAATIFLSRVLNQRSSQLCSVLLGNELFWMRLTASRTTRARLPSPSAG
jgi:hypothetical protein